MARGLVGLICCALHAACAQSRTLDESPVSETSSVATYDLEDGGRRPESRRPRPDGSQLVEDSGPPPKPDGGETDVEGAAGDPGMAPPIGAVALECPAPTEDTLARVRRGIVGNWEGTVETPWTTQPSPAPVQFEFYADGRYSARCLEPMCGALYYGTDEDHPSKVYEVTEAVDDRTAKGTLVIYFGGSGTNVTEGINDFELSGDCDTLSFSFLHFGKYGPVEYELVRR